MSDAPFTVSAYAGLRVPITDDEDIVDEARLEYVIDTVEKNSSISSTRFATRVDVGGYTLIFDILYESFACRVNCRIETRSDTFQNLFIILTSFV